jgi:hypothetical protein
MVQGDTVQPGQEALLKAEAVKVAKSPHQNVLGALLRVFAVPEKGKGKPEQHFLVAIHNEPERLRVAVKYFAYDGQVLCFPAG